MKEYEDSNYIGCVVWLSGGKKEIFLRKWFDETVKSRRENQDHNKDKKNW